MPEIADNGKKRPVPKKKGLTERGKAGLYSKLTDADRQRIVPRELPNKASLVRVVSRHRIAPALQHLAVPMNQLVPDPNNARVHPERNLEAIKLSLEMYGQLKPLVVRSANNVVIAGNGTLEAARALGWTELAVHFVDLNEVEAAGFGMADNRSAELAKWDFEVVAHLDRLLQEQGHATVGWSRDELEVLRAADWLPPTETEDGYNHGGSKLTLTLTVEQLETWCQALSLVRTSQEGELTDAECLQLLCLHWTETH